MVTMTTRAPSVDREETVAPVDDASLARYRLAERVAADVIRAEGTRVDRAEVLRYAREAVEELYSSPVKVTVYLPLLATRRVRERLQGR